MNIFGIGLPEMAVIAAIGLLVFGPKRLPELGKTLGRTLRGFQSASQEFEQEFRSAVASSEATAATAAPFLASAGSDGTGSGGTGLASSVPASPASVSPAGSLADGLIPEGAASNPVGTTAVASGSEPDSALAYSLASTRPEELSPQPAETLR